MKLHLALLPMDAEMILQKKIKINNTLMSFYYFRNKGHLFNEIQKISKHVILDSGAFSLFFSKKKSDKNTNWDSYIEEYADFINKYNVKNFIELDIERLVGMKEMERLRIKLEKLTGKQCIPVWHGDRGLNYLKKMIQTYKYIAISEIYSTHQEKTKYIKQIVAYCISKKVKIHGLAFTKIKLLKEIPFYSIDSSSWNGVMFQYKYYQYRNGCLLSKTVKGFNSKENRKLVEHNMKQWILYSQYLENIHDKYIYKYEK